MKSSDLERDLGILISKDLKWSNQCKKAAAKANRMLGRLKNTFVSRSSSIWKKLYLAYIRPQLEFAVPIWSPYLEGDIKRIEDVQHKATRTPSELQGLPYDEKCRRWGIQSLRERRVRGDLIQKFKIEKNFDKVSWFVEPPFVVNNTTGRRRFHREPLNGCDQRFNFFSNRVVNPWNSLPDSVVQLADITSFKIKIDEFKKCELRLY